MFPDRSHLEDLFPHQACKLHLRPQTLRREVLARRREVALIGSGYGAYQGR